MEVIFLTIIDAHLHYVPEVKYFNTIADNAESENSEAGLRAEFHAHHIACGIVMGNAGLNPEDNRFPDFLRYCIGIEAYELGKRDNSAAIDKIEANLRRPQCVGIKLYPGYSSVYITDRRYEPVYELAEKYDKPVAVHTGQTAGSNAMLRYSHPLTIDDAAVLHPHVRFVMCHYGNPFLMDAAAVAEKNGNVSVDLSGLIEGKLSPSYFQEQCHYLEALRTWITYVEDYSKFMFGTDWPLANYSDYIELTRQIIPEKHWEAVFHKNAERIYQLHI